MANIKVTFKDNEYFIAEDKLASTYAALQLQMTALSDGTGGGGDEPDTPDEPVTPPAPGGLENWPTNPDAENPIITRFSYGKLIDPEYEYYGLYDVPSVLSDPDNILELIVEDNTTWGDFITKYPNSGFSLDAESRVLYDNKPVYLAHVLTLGRSPVSYQYDVIYVNAADYIGYMYDPGFEDNRSLLEDIGGYVVESEVLRKTITRNIMDGLYTVPALTTWAEFIDMHPELDLAVIWPGPSDSASGGTIGKTNTDMALVAEFETEYDGLVTYAAYENEYVEGPFYAGEFARSVNRYKLSED